jgi:hypothetical protein
MIYKGSGLQAEQLSSLLVDIGKGTASTFVVVESSDIGDHDTYSVCYTAQFGKNQSAHQYCSGPLTHHGENHNITLSASYGDILS